MFLFYFQEVERIRNEHQDDPSAVINDRVKGLKVTRAFGAGFLKQVLQNMILSSMLIKSTLLADIGRRT